MGKNSRSFKVSLEKFGKVTREQAEQIFKKIVLDLESAVVLRTPVDTGRARGNWFPTIGTASNQRDDDLWDPGGQKSIAAIAAQVGLLTLGDVAWLSNNLPYINRLEEGWSKQAPSGMVSVELARAQSKYGGTTRRI
jgi:hypothetical protein